MSEFNLKIRKKHLKEPVKPLKIKNNTSVADLLGYMGDTAFQGKNLSLAADVWFDMVNSKNTMIFFGLAGAMIPAGMREIMVHLNKQRYIDCLVSTGANLFHDIHETLGFDHWKGSAEANDSELREAGLDRMYDVYGVDDEFNDSDEYIYRFAAGLEKRPYTTREFFYLMGEDLVKRAKRVGKHKGPKRDGIITSAYKAGVPIYCPAVADSSIGIALAMIDGDENFIFDLIGDVKETAHLASTPAQSGVVICGGGTPKNFIHQTEVTADMMGKPAPGHKYALQITADAPHWGGLSGCTFSEAESWGKIHKKAQKVTVNSDTTIALPIIVTALTQKMKGKKRALKNTPKIDFKGAQNIKVRKWDAP